MENFCGVAGEFFQRPRVNSSEFVEQTFKSGWRRLPDGDRVRFVARFDDGDLNGHNSFSITGDLADGSRIYGGGCIHEDIEKAFPEVEHLIKWHLCSSDGPMHYVANTLFLAGDRDCWGARKGEARQWKTVITFGDNPIQHTLDHKFTAWLEEHGPACKYDFELIEMRHDKDREKFGPKATFGGFATRWHECPFDSMDEADRFLSALQNCEPTFQKIATVFGEGSERDFDAARVSAVWPDASEEILSQDRETLKAALLERLPRLLASMRSDIEAAGFAWSAETIAA